MYGRGNIDDAKQLQAEFARSKTSKSSRGGNRGNSRAGANSRARGGHRGGRGQDRVQAQPSPQYGQQQDWATPAAQYTPTRQNMQKRAAFGEQDNTPKRTRGGLTATPPRGPVQGSGAPLPGFNGQQFGQYGQNSQGNYFQPQTSYPSFQQGPSVRQQKSPDEDLMDIEQSSPRFNTAPQQLRPHHGHPTGSVSPTPSLLDEGWQGIQQPVMEFTVGNNTRAASQGDVTMGGTDTTTKNRASSNRGLAASRWHPNNRRSPEPSRPEPRAWGRPPRESPERRGPFAPPTGIIVTSGMLQGPGLADSSWAPISMADSPSRRR